MKLKFDSNLQYQEEAIASVVDLFKGQAAKKTLFTVSTATMPVVMDETQTSFLEEQTVIEQTITTNGVGNRLELTNDEILANLQEVQLRNGIKQTKSLKQNNYDFDIEMETGTGKTYVYLRTIYELNKNYGFTKFIIVVPSIAIKEGVYKTMQITEEHFDNLYDNTSCDYFIYDSKKPEQIRSFAVNDNISIMIINIDAFRKDVDKSDDSEGKANLIHRKSDRLSGMKPIELIQETNPFVIIDEPQSVDTTDKSKKAIESLNPICKLRYSATHVEKHNQVYKLDAVDAFNLGLVKQIEVASFESANAHNLAYMLLKSVDNKKTPITAQIELDCEVRGKISRQKKKIKAGDDLYDITNREVYRNYIVDEIYCEEGNEYVSFATSPEILRIGSPVGEIDDSAIKTQQIRKTIEEHLNKELILHKHGIKVLSLFFIDKVANYRIYDEDGTPKKGKYAEIFEEQYADLIKRPKYDSIREDAITGAPAEEVHNGYFSIDRKGALKDTSGKTADDENAYNLIMKDKEKLLSFDTKLRFIFSHSTLREGWDNPNVFQICTLNETNSEVKKRQEIGRGLRLCVDQTGERKHGNTINTLTVMANESYEEFAEKLQKEYEQEEGIRFGIVEKYIFANVPIQVSDGSTQYLGQEQSEKVHTHLLEHGYIDDNNKVQDKLKEAIKDDNIDLPNEFEQYREKITQVCRKAAGNLNIKKAKEKKVVQLNKGVYLSPEFKELWDKVKFKSTYRVELDSNKLIEECSKEIKQSMHVTPSKLVYVKASIDVEKSGVDSKEKLRMAIQNGEIKPELPDVVSYLQNQTNLTRKTIVEILLKCERLNDFKLNPQSFMEQAAEIIKTEMQNQIVDGIKYTKIGDDAFYAQELFETEELTGYLESNMVEANKSVFDYVVYDSEKEKGFAEKLESNDCVKLYAKLPDWFTISTPLGGYNPDWAILVDKDGESKLYFVVETKGNINKADLRSSEWNKIRCGQKHFSDLGDEVATYTAVDDYNEFIGSI